MFSSRSKVFLREFAVGVVGAIAGITLTHWVVSRLAHTWAWVALGAAVQYQNAGDGDRAVFVLSQATAIDPNFYGSYELLGDIYSRKGNQQFALEMYKKALEAFDRERFLPLGRTNKNEQESILSKIQTLEKQLKNQRRGPPQR